MIMRCVAIDDEPLALAQMGKYIEKTSFLELAGTFRNAVDASVWLRKYAVDLLFVDINMPGLNGLDFVRQLEVKPLIVFVTAYSEYALEGFRVDATDYLLKPISYAAFLHSSEKAYKHFRLLKGSLTQLNHPDEIFVKSEYKVVPVKLESVLYIESQSEYVRIFMEEGKPLMTLGSLKSYEDKLPGSKFMRVHRSYIVNLHKISAIERKHLIFPNNITIPIGDLYEDKFKEYLSRKLYK